MSWNEDIRKCQDDIRDEILDIYYISTSADNMGLHYLSGKLNGIAERIESSVIQIDKVLSNKIHGDFKQAQDAIGDTLSKIMEKEK